MKKLIFGFVFAALFLGVAGTASAGHRHYSGCGHSGYGYYRSHHYAYAPVYVAPRPVVVAPAPVVVVPAPVIAAPVYANYWHDHYYRGGYNRCHYYGGRHHYGYYRPHTGFHFGISIFR
jgi:hypothetical protein